MNDEDLENPTSNFGSQTYQVWSPTQQIYQSKLSINSKNMTFLDFYLEPNVKNSENIQKITIDSQYRDICPVWKPALQGTKSIFENF